MKLLITLVIDALALAAAAWLVDGIYVDGATNGDQALTLIIVAAIFAVVNAFVKPVVKLLSLPFIILTLGLLLFVINALMLMFTGWIADQFDLGFHVDGFWPAVWGSIVVTLASWLLSVVLPDGD